MLTLFTCLSLFTSGTYIDIFLLDGTREAFLLNESTINTDYFPHLGNLTVPSIRRTVVVEVPTYTTNCLHSMFTGKVRHPLHVILSLAPAVYSLVEGSAQPTVLDILKTHGYSISATGDDTLEKLFPYSFDSVRTAYSFSISDYDTVDNMVISALEDRWNGKINSNTLGAHHFHMHHFLGSDHIIHSEGLASPLVKQRYNVYDELIYKHIMYLHNICTSGKDSYIVMVLSDHGMSDAGTHGGSSGDETRTPFLLFTSNQNLYNVLETHLGPIVPQRQILFSVLAALFKNDSIANIPQRAFTASVSPIDIAMIVLDATMLIAIAAAMLILSIHVSPAIIICQGLCAICARFANNETPALLGALVVEVLWKTKMPAQSAHADSAERAGNNEIVTASHKLTLKHLTGYGAWTAALLFLTRDPKAALPVIVSVYLFSYNLRAEIRYIVLHLMMLRMGHLGVFTYAMPKLYLSLGPDSTTDTRSGCIYVLLTDFVPFLLHGSIYDLLNASSLLFSALLFRWHPLYNSVCVSKLLVGLVLYGPVAIKLVAGLVGGPRHKAGCAQLVGRRARSG